MYEKLTELSEGFPWIVTAGNITHGIIKTLPYCSNISIKRFTAML